MPGLGRRPSVDARDQSFLMRRRLSDVRDLSRLLAEDGECCTALQQKLKAAA